MALQEISRQEAISMLDRGESITVAIKVKRPLQAGMRPIDNQEHYMPIFWGELQWVEEPNRFIVSTREELLAVVRALRAVDADYCDFFNYKFGNSGLVDLTVYTAPKGARRSYGDTLEIVIDPYNWRLPAGGEWTRIGRDYTIVG